jgi:hypothetical protein
MNKSTKCKTITQLKTFTTIMRESLIWMLASLIKRSRLFYLKVIKATNPKKVDIEFNLSY